MQVTEALLFLFGLSQANNSIYEYTPPLSPSLPAFLRKSPVPTQGPHTGPQVDELSTAGDFRVFFFFLCMKHFSNILSSGHHPLPSPKPGIAPW